MNDLLELDEESHWSASWSLRHPLALEVPLEPAWDRLLIIRRRWRHDIQRIRAEVVDEVKAMIEESCGGATAGGRQVPEPDGPRHLQSTNAEYVRKKIGARRTGEFDDQLLQVAVEMRSAKSSRRATPSASRCG